MNAFDFLDMLGNVVTFTFIGALIYLYLRKETED